MTDKPIPTYRRTLTGFSPANPEAEAFWREVPLGKFISPDILKKMIDYDPETGFLFWKERPLAMFEGTPYRFPERACNVWNARYVGARALNHIDKSGYCRGAIFSKSYAAHRVAWAITHGEWPDSQIDHINGVRNDNRLTNLRLVTAQANSQNRGMRSDNKTGVMGVCLKRGKYLARIHSNGRELHLGYFDTISAATAARERAARKLGYHPNHGRKA